MLCSCPCSGRKCTSDLWFGLITCFLRWLLTALPFTLALRCMNKLPWVFNREAQPPPLSFPGVYLCDPRPASYRYSPAALPRALESITDTKAGTSPHARLGHLSCCRWKTQKDPLTVMSEQRAECMHGQKQCKVHSSKGCVKNISAPKNLTASRMCVIASFSFHDFVLLMDLCWCLLGTS